MAGIVRAPCILGGTSNDRIQPETVPEDQDENRRGPDMCLGQADEEDFKIGMFSPRMEVKDPRL